MLLKFENIWTRIGQVTWLQNMNFLKHLVYLKWYKIFETACFLKFYH